MRDAQKGRGAAADSGEGWHAKSEKGTCIVFALRALKSDTSANRASRMP